MIPVSNFGSSRYTAEFVLIFPLNTRPDVPAMNQHRPNSCWSDGGFVLTGVAK